MVMGVSEQVMEPEKGEEKGLLPVKKYLFHLDAQILNIPCKHHSYVLVHVIFVNPQETKVKKCINTDK